MKQKIMTQKISYRLRDDHHIKIGEKATKRGISVNDWCREAALEKLEHDEQMPSARDIFEELGSLNYIVRHAFRLIAKEELSVAEWDKLRGAAQQHRIEIAAEIVAKRRKALPQSGAASGKAPLK